jgi:ATP-dependent protease ClpP protease subunit
MGALILCAFDRRLAYPASRFMLHDGTTEVSGTIRDVEKDVESDRLSRLDQYRILAEATGKPAKYWARKLANNYHLSAEQALAEGLIDEII